MNKSHKRLATLAASAVLVAAPVFAPTAATAQPTDYNYLENTSYSQYIPDWIKEKYGVQYGSVVNNPAMQVLSSLSIAPFAILAVLTGNFS